MTTFPPETTTTCPATAFDEEATRNPYPLCRRLREEGGIHRYTSLDGLGK